MESDEVASSFINIKDPKVRLNGEPVESELAAHPAVNLTNGWEAFAKREEDVNLFDALNRRRIRHSGEEDSAEVGRVVKL